MQPCPGVNADKTTRRSSITMSGYFPAGLSPTSHCGGSRPADSWRLRPAPLSVGMHLDVVDDVFDAEHVPGIEFRHLALRLVAQDAGERHHRTQDAHVHVRLVDQRIAL